MKNMLKEFESGKKKAITFSYDDGTMQDIRLIELLDKYGLKATFNLNSEFLGNEGSVTRDNRPIPHNKVKAEDVRYIYENHEIAGHTLKHRNLTLLEEAEVIRTVEQDRLNLSELAGYEVIGFAYPCGGVNNDDRVAELLKNNTGTKYCRTITSSHSFDPQANLYRFNPTADHHNEWDKTMELAEQFLSLKTDEPKVFYIWGHAFEFDIFDDWKKFEGLCEMLSGHKDIFYGTNREVFGV